MKFEVNIPGVLINKALFGSYFLLTTASLIYYYRQGGQVDAIYGGIAKPGMRDVGIYVQAAQNVLQGINPYSLQTMGFRSGTFGVLIFALFGSNSISFITLQILNILGTLFFTYALLKNKASSDQILALSITSLWFSCSREILSTGQITGIMMGLLGLGYSLLKSKSKFSQTIAALAFAIVLDLKPHLYVVFIVSVYIYHRKAIWLWVVSFYLIMGHIIINFYFRTFLEYDLLRILLAVSDTSTNPENSGTRTIWPLVRSVLQLGSLPSFVPLLTFICLGLIVLLKVHRTPNLFYVFAGLLVPVTYNYFHLYSFLPIAILLVWALVRFELPIFLGIMFSFLVVTGNNLELKVSLVSLSIFVIFLFLIYRVFDSRSKFVFRFSVSFCFVHLIRCILSFSTAESYFIEIVNINVLVLGTFLAFFLGSRNLSTR